MEHEEKTTIPHVSPLAEIFKKTRQTEKKWYVYLLCDPDTEQPFYVGKGTGNRIDQHEFEAKDPYASNPMKQEVIRRILAQGKKVLKRKIAEFDNEHDAYILERELINHYGPQLTNIRPGGGTSQTNQRPDFLIPTEQQIIYFHNRPIIVAHFDDGRTGIVLHYLCKNLRLDSHGQYARIKRTEAMAEDLVYAQIQTDGGPQVMPTLLARSLPYWLATIDTRQMKKDDERRQEILSYQREVVRVFGSMMQQPFVMQIARPKPPVDGASFKEWREYHQQMIIWIDQQKGE